MFGLEFNCCPHMFHCRMHMHDSRDGERPVILLAESAAVPGRRKPSPLRSAGVRAAEDMISTSNII